MNSILTLIVFVTSLTNIFALSISSQNSVKFNHSLMLKEPKYNNINVNNNFNNNGDNNSENSSINILLKQLMNRCERLTFELTDGHRFVPSIDENNLFETTILTNEFSDICLKKCSNIPECVAVNYDGEECVLLQTVSISATINGSLQESSSSLSSPSSSLSTSNSTARASIFARKFCLTDRKKRCEHRQWSFEHIPGYVLESQNSMLQRKTLKNILDSHYCEQLCLDETAFDCRSAQYDHENHDCTLYNLNRHTIQYPILDSKSDSNQTLTFTKSQRNSVVYLENQCIQESRKFCDFRRLKNRKLNIVNSVQNSIPTLSECRELCLEDVQCRMFEYDSDSRRCRMSHFTELSGVFVKNAFIFSKEDSIKLFEIATCYNVSIDCGARSMNVEIETSRLFNGKIYPRSQPRNCVKDITNALKFNITMPYLNGNGKSKRNSDNFGDKNGNNNHHRNDHQNRGDNDNNNDDDNSDNVDVDGEHGTYQCDTKQSEPGTFVNDIVIQHHDLVLTTRDLSVGVHCRFDLRNDSVARVDLKIQGDILTEKLKGHAELPELSLHVVDAKGNDIEEVNVGDLLRVQVKMSDEDTYGIFVRNLIARDSSNPGNNFTLIDGKGCPLHLKMFREMRRMDSDSKSLESYMEAFTFTGGNLLLIEAEVETCLDKCRPMQCLVATGRSNDQSETVISYGRRRRRRSIVTDVDQAEKGDVLSMTMLTKSLLIRSRRETIVPKYQHNQPPPPSSSSSSSSWSLSSPPLSSSSLSGVDHNHNTKKKTITNEAQRKTTSSSKPSLWSFPNQSDNENNNGSGNSNAAASGNRNTFGYFHKNIRRITSPSSLSSPSTPSTATRRDEHEEAGYNESETMPGESGANNNHHNTNHHLYTAGRRLPLTYLHTIIANKNFVCFEPLNLLLICAFSLCLQGALFTLLFYCFTRSYRRSAFKSYSPASSSCSASSGVGKLSESSSHLYSRHRLSSPYSSIQ